MSLRVWLPLNKDLRNQGLSNVTTTSSASIISNYCCMCNSSNYPTFNYTIDQANTFSFAFWIKIPTSITSHTNWQSFVTFGIHDNISNTDAYCNLSWAPYNNLKIFDANNYQLLWKNMPYDTWTHLVIVSETINSVWHLKVYKDGILYDSASANGVGPTLISNQLFLGSGVDSTKGSVYFSDFRIYDHALSKKEVAELARGCVLHYPMNDTLNESTVNLVSSITAGGQTTVSNGVVTTSGVHADTYFTLNLSESIVSGTQYTISCETDMPLGTYWDFPLGEQGNTDLTWRLKPGYNTYTFTANNISWGTQQIFMDDNGGTARTSGYQCKFWNFQLEKKDHATPYTPSSRTQTQLKDVSGFDNNGSISGTLSLVNDSSPRYALCGKFTYLVTSSFTPNLNTTSLSYGGWFKFNKTEIASILSTLTIDSVHHTPTGNLIGNHNYGGNGLIWATNNMYNDGQFNNLYIFSNLRNSSDTIFSQTSDINVEFDTWIHLFVVYDISNSSLKLYRNGVLFNAQTFSNPSNFPSRVFYVNYAGVYAGNGPTSSIPFKSSDIRIYKNALTAADISNLYKDSLSIDKSQNGYCYELNESDAQSSVDVKKNGQLVCKNYSETITSIYDDNAYVEPDGSVWIRIFHHNSPGTSGLFSSTDTFTTKVYKDANRWFNVSVCNNVSKWELMVKQKAESTSVEQKYRWIQPTNPMEGSFNDTVATNITKYTSSQGYTDIPSSYGGIYCEGGATYIVQNDSISGDWWGAIGSWTAYQGGIPGIAGIIPTSGYLDLYLRVDNLDEDTIARIGKNSNVAFNNLTEI